MWEYRFRRVTSWWRQEKGITLFCERRFHRSLTAKGRQGGQELMLQLEIALPQVRHIDGDAAMNRSGSREDTKMLRGDRPGGLLVAPNSSKPKTFQPCCCYLSNTSSVRGLVACRSLPIRAGPQQCEWHCIRFSILLGSQLLLGFGKPYRIRHPLPAVSSAYAPHGPSGTRDASRTTSVAVSLFLSKLPLLCMHQLVEFVGTRVADPCDAFRCVHRRVFQLPRRWSCLQDVRWSGQNDRFRHSGFIGIQGVSGPVRTVHPNDASGQVRIVVYVNEVFSQANSVEQG